MHILYCDTFSALVWYLFRQISILCGTFFEFEHNYYNEKGENLARCEMSGGWINLKSRKLTSLPNDILKKFQTSNKTSSFKEISSKDTRRWNRGPRDLD